MGSCSTAPKDQKQPQSKVFVEQHRHQATDTQSRHEQSGKRPSPEAIPPIPWSSTKKREAETKPKQNLLEQKVLKESLARQKREYEAKLKAAQMEAVELRRKLHEKELATASLMEWKNAQMEAKQRRLERNHRKSGTTRVTQIPFSASTNQMASTNQRESTNQNLQIPGHVPDDGDESFVNSKKQRMKMREESARIPLDQRELNTRLSTNQKLQIRVNKSELTAEEQRRKMVEESARIRLELKSLNEDFEKQNMENTAKLEVAQKEADELKRKLHHAVMDAMEYRKSRDEVKMKLEKYKEMNAALRHKSTNQKESTNQNDLEYKSFDQFQELPNTNRKILIFGRDYYSIRPEQDDHDSLEPVSIYFQYWHK